MSTIQSQFEFIFDQLSFLEGLRARKMFGEYGLYSGHKFFGMISNDQLFLKSTPNLRSILADDGVRAYDGASDGYFHIPDETLEELEILKKYTKASLDFVPKPKKSKK